MRPFPLCATLLCLAGAAAEIRAETHRLVPSVFYNTFSAAHVPALRIRSGDRVVTSTVDDMGIDASGRTVAPGPHPQTGPFYVEDAEPGDLLVVTIDKLEPNRATGMSRSVMAVNAAEPASFSRRQDSRRLEWIVDKANGVVRFDLRTIGGRNSDWPTRFDRPAFELPLQPTLGSVAVAPAAGDAVTTTAAGPFGGNMVSAGLVAGSRVMLPVFQPGALLFLGHGQARQGDGRVADTGIETSLDVEFSVEVVKKREWPHSSVPRPSTVVGEFDMEWPRVETDDYLMTVGTAPGLLPALQHATLELHHWLDDDFGLSEQAVTILIGQAMEYEVANIAEANSTVVAKVRKSYLPRPSVAP
jgi:amidase